MPKITSIEKQKRKERVNIYVDDTFFTGVSLEIVYQLGLRKDQEVDIKRLQQVIEEESYRKAKEKALQLLKFCSRTEKEIIKRLRKQEFIDTIIDRVIKFLKEYDFIDDEKFAKSAVRNKSMGKKYGKNRIKQDLYKKGIDKEKIERALEDELDETREYENALQLAQKKKQMIKEEDYRKVYQKIGRFLAYRGYEYDVIKKVLGKVMKSEEEFY